MRTLLRTAFALLLAAPALLPASSNPPVITWNAPTVISGDSDVVNSGSLVWAYNLTFSTTGSLAVNGVTFTGAPFTNGDANSINFGSNLTLSSSNALYGQDNAFGSASAPYSGLSANYQSLLQSGIYTSGYNLMILTLNNASLVQGQEYLIQIWVNDSRSGVTAPREQQVNDSHNNTVNMLFNTTQVAGGLGQFITGTFTANTWDPSIYLTQIGGDEYNDTAQIQAISLQAIPEPSTYAALAGLAALGLVALRRLAPVSRREN